MMTMANSTTSSTPRNGVSLRKTNKPLMEKRRRARINDSLTQLKTLVIHSSKKDSSQFSKLEKADILELTVKHLRGLQQQQQIQGNPSDNNTNNKYRSGFVECANEVIRYLDQSQGFNNDTKSKVISHLAQCLQLVSHVQPKQVPAPAAPSTTILNQPSTAATTTQLPNGQIIQIVSNPIQNLPQASAGILGFKQPVSSIQGFNITSNIAPSSSIQATTSQSTPATSQTAYVRYAQPLHIQIPPLVSPVLIQQTQPAREVVTKETNTSTLKSSNERIPEMVSSTNMVSPLSKSEAVSSSSPPSHSSLPKVRAQKQLNFYSPEEINIELLARSRSYSLTSSSSSSSSSSPETEMTSPLNLSQSPPYPSQNPETHHQQYRHQPSSLSHHAIPEHYHHLSHPVALKANEKSSHSQIGHSFSSDKNFTINTTSVIVNSRKYNDFPESKYFSMMDDDRHCIHSHSTPSPTSSVGEERLWRPW